MIPLIDVSLVLLVYFLMSTSSLGSGTSTKLPVAEFASVQEIKGQVWIEIENKNNLLIFKTGFADKKKAPPSEFNTQENLISYLELEIRKGQGNREVTIYAPGEITAGIIRNLTTLIEKTLGEKEISKIHLGVTGKK